MTLPKDVNQAVSKLDDSHELLSEECWWEVVRAHLLNQDAEIERYIQIAANLAAEAALNMIRAERAETELGKIKKELKEAISIYF